jgi:hypothetical protein
MLAAGALYSAYGGQAYLFMALLSAGGLSGVWRLRRSPAHSAERPIEGVAR